MKKAHELAKAITPGSCEDSPATKKSTNPKLVIRLFAVLAAQYGNRWTSLIQNEESDNAMRKVWGEGLVDINPEKIKSAVDMLPNEYPSWPPTMGQFLALCKIGDDPIRRPQLPKPRGDEKIALDALAEINQILGNK